MISKLPIVFLLFLLSALICSINDRKPVLHRGGVVTGGGDGAGLWGVGLEGGFGGATGAELKADANGGAGVGAGLWGVGLEGGFGGVNGAELKTDANGGGGVGAAAEADGGAVNGASGNGRTVSVAARGSDGGAILGADTSGRAEEVALSATAVAREAGGGAGAAANAGGGIGGILP